MKSYPAQKSVGMERAPGPKVCRCGKRGEVQDTKSYPEHFRRRYKCVCGNRWSTYEVVPNTEEDTAIAGYQGPGTYEHFKGKPYFAIGLTKHSESGELCVVYRPLYQTADWDGFVHRPLDSWNGEVAAPGAQAAGEPVHMVPRFRKLS